MSSQIEAKFFTKQDEYAVPDTPYTLPGTVTVKELNALIKSVLNGNNPEENADVEFDFLLSGELLRLSLHDHLEAKNIPSEHSVEIEYFVKYPAPSPENSLQHDDWVSAVKVTEDWILSGCYDDTLHIWTIGGEHKLTIPGHVAPIKSVSWLNIGNPVSSFISTSHDETAMVWEWNQETNSVDCVHVCKGHARSVDCVDINPTEHKFATGSYDQMLKIWSSDLQPDVEESVSRDGDRKRFKTADGKTKVKTPLMTLSGHTDGISGVQWMDNNEICTSSMDSTLRLWDIELGGLKTQLNGSKAFFGLSYSHISKLVVTASADRHVRLWDPRSKDGMLVKSVFTSHTGWITAVRWSPTDEHQFISGSHDHLVKLWDTRSPKTPLFDLSGHEDKVLAIDWSSQNRIVSGGTDNHVKIYRIQDNQISSDLK